MHYWGHLTKLYRGAMLLVSSSQTINLSSGVKALKRSTLFQDLLPRVLIWSLFTPFRSMGQWQNSSNHLYRWPGVPSASRSNRATQASTLVPEISTSFCLLLLAYWSKWNSYLFRSDLHLKNCLGHYDALQDSLKKVAYKSLNIHRTPVQMQMFNTRKKSAVSTFWLKRALKCV